MSNHSNASPERELKARQRTRSSGGLTKYVLFALVALIILALALGLGLGLGLKHKSHSSSSSSPSTSSPTQKLTPQQPTAFILNSSIPANQTPQTRFFEFNVTSVKGSPDGFEKDMLVVNGLYPGPTIEANQGDRIVVTVNNGIANTTSIHWHGLFQNGTNWYDGSVGITECGIPSGQSLTYNFTFGEFAGTTWWHAHASTLYTDGITGALIVHPTASPGSKTPAFNVSEEIVFQLNDWYHTPSGQLLKDYFDPFGIEGTPGNEPVPDAGTINGFGQYNNTGQYFNVTLEPNKTYRLRLVNTGSFASVRFSVDNHTLTVVEADGTIVEPFVVSGVVLAVAQRYSVLLTTNQTSGNYWIRGAVQDDMFTYDQPGANYDIRGILKYASNNSTSDALPTATDDPGAGPGTDNIGDLDTSLLVPNPPLDAPEATRLYKSTFFFEFTSDARWLGFMNTTSWGPLKGNTTLLSVHNNPTGYANPNAPSIAGGFDQQQFLVSEDSIQVVDLAIDNLDDGDHPFHLHGHRPWIVGSGDGRYTGQPLNTKNPLRRDTQIIPQYSWVVLRFITDNPGLWAFHCHIAWHMASGLLLQINSLPSKLATLDVPQTIVDHCKAQSQQKSADEVLCKNC